MKVLLFVLGLYVVVTTLILTDLLLQNKDGNRKDVILMTFFAIFLPFLLFDILALTYIALWG